MVKNPFFAIILKICPIIGLFSCAPSTFEPIERHFGWFSTVAGDDLRESCGAGFERYRFVYNGRYADQVRIYDLGVRVDGGADLQAKVRGEINLLRFELFDPLGPWRGQIAQRALTVRQMDGVRAALDRSGFAGPTPAGLRLPSDGYYWVAAGCRDGRFHYNAWLHPGGAAAMDELSAVLLALDPTTEPFNRPGPDLGAAEPPRTPVHFVLTVGMDGLVAMPDMGRLLR